MIRDDKTEHREEKKWKDEEEILHGKVQIERKMFSFSLRENPRGRFLRITEDVGCRREAIIIPSTGLTQFRDMIDRAMKLGDGDSPKAAP